MEKKVILVFLISLILLNFVSAVEVVEVPQDTPKEEGALSGMFAFLKSPVFWGAMVVICLAVIFIFIIFLIIRWAIQFLKVRSDLYWRVRKERIQLAKAHRSYPSKHWYRIEKNVPIRLVRVWNGKPEISKPIGYHRGDYTTHEGNLIIAMSVIGRKKWLMLPEVDLLVIPDKISLKILQTTEKGETQSVTMDNIPVAKDIVKFNENEILIYAESMSKIGLFFIPVIKSKDGKVIDLSLPIYTTLKEVVLSDYLFEQSSEFVSIAKKAIDMNPNIRAVQKIGDQNSAVDLDANKV